jgi:DNA-binding transcriptional regulator/RsmH inhibitor MraZ
VTGDVLQTVKRHGYLRDWERDRWERAEQELAQARLLQARQRYQEMAMTAVGDILEADRRERMSMANLLGNSTPFYDKGYPERSGL